MFSGYDRSGKDSAYYAVSEKWPCQRIAQADHLKELGSKYFGTSETMKGTGAEEYYRMVLTKLSDVIKDVTDSLYFPKYLIQNIGLEKLCSDKIFVCTDGRYDYEIQCFENIMGRYCITHRINHMFYPIKITRPAVPPTKYAEKNHNFPKYQGFFKEIVNTDYKKFKKEIQDTVKAIYDIHNK